MKYRVECSVQMIECLKQLDRHSASILLRWVRSYLEGCEDPRARGRWVAGAGGWKYNAGEYRILAEIRKESGCILLLWISRSKTDDR